MHEKPKLAYEIYGDLGERFCEEYYLSEEMDDYARAELFSGIGTSLLDNRYNGNFDVQDMRVMASSCRVFNIYHGICGHPRESMPCRHDEFYEFNSSPCHLLNYLDIGCKKYSWYCSMRNTYVFLEDEGGSSHLDRFLRDYLLCHFFIVNLYQNKGEVLSVKERSFLNSKWKFHPGKIDYFSVKDGKYYCVEVKTNKSDLSIWQKLRLVWMSSRGHGAKVCRVNFNIPEYKKIRDLYLLSPSEALGAIDDKSYAIEDVCEYSYPEVDFLLNDENRFMRLALSGNGVINI